MRPTSKTITLAALALFAATFATFAVANASEKPDAEIGCPLIYPAAECVPDTEAPESPDPGASAPISDDSSATMHDSLVSPDAGATEPGVDTPDDGTADAGWGFSPPNPGADCVVQETYPVTVVCDGGPPVYEFPNADGAGTGPGATTPAR